MHGISCPPLPRMRTFATRSSARVQGGNVPWNRLASGHLSLKVHQEAVPPRRPVAQVRFHRDNRTTYVSVTRSSPARSRGISSTKHGSSLPLRKEVPLTWLKRCPLRYGRRIAMLRMSSGVDFNDFTDYRGYAIPAFLETTKLVCVRTYVFPNSLILLDSPVCAI
jgi:hypothetical protein